MHLGHELLPGRLLLMLQPHHLLSQPRRARVAAVCRCPYEVLLAQFAPQLRDARVCGLDA
eukprot:210923-Chlamydomonas_euryale.AAC.1